MTYFYTFAVFLFGFNICLSTAANINGVSICVPGKITGQPCPAVEDILGKYQPVVDNTRKNLRIKIQEYSNRINSLRELLIKHDSETRKDIRNKMSDFRKIINKAKQETATSSPAIQACIRKREVELNKVAAKRIRYCNLASNLTTLNSIKNTVVKLEQVMGGSLMHCKSLNPLQTQIHLLEQCIQNKIQDMSKQIQFSDKQFEEAGNKIIDSSLQCNRDMLDDVFDEISYIFGALKDCRFANN